MRRVKIIESLNAQLEPMRDAAPSSFSTHVASVSTRTINAAHLSAMHSSALRETELRVHHAVFWSDISHGDQMPKEPRASVRETRSVGSGALKGE
jgi:hypothetical protein